MGAFDDLDESFQTRDLKFRRQPRTRGFVCTKGHLYVPGSFRVTAAGHKRCLICKREYERKYYARKG